MKTKGNKSKSGNERSYKQLKTISEAALLEEASHFRLIFQSIVVVFTLMVLLIVWASLIKIDEVTRSYGELIPMGRVYTVQSLDGGSVKQLYVNNGELVKKGQVLAVFDTTAQEAELNQLRSKEISFILDSSRLNAFLNNENADIEGWGKRVVASKYNPVKYKTEINTLLSDQKRLLEQQYQNLHDSAESLKNTIAQREEKLKELQQQRKIWKVHIDLLMKEFNMYQKLKEKGYLSDREYLTMLRAVNKAKGDGANIVSEIEQAKDSISQAQNQLKELNSSARKDALETLGKINSDLLEVRHRIEKLVNRISNATVTAPITGFVKGLEIRSGNVIKPGGILFEIVPQGGKLMVECKILPQDIGFIKVGAKVKVKVLTYNYARFGSINGKLIQISATTFDDKEGKPYYRADVELEKQYLGSESDRKDLIAGMTVEADIITGKKTLMEYLLKPIQRSVSSSFHER